MKTGFQFVEVDGQFMHRCVILSHDVLVFKLLFACLASNINCCAGLQKHGNNQKW